MATETGGQTNPTSQPTDGPAGTSTGCVSSGAVAGIAVGVGIGIALIATLATFFIMRRHHQSKARSRRRLQHSKSREDPKQNSVSRHGRPTEAEGPLRRDGNMGSEAIDDYLPQATDDQSLRLRTSTFLDQIELFAENFCQEEPDPQAKVATSELSTFDSPYLTKPLSSLLTQSQNALPLVKHSLAQHIINLITTGAPPEHTLLPAEFSLLPCTVIASARHATEKAGFTQCLSRWRVLSAYLRPDPSSDTKYITDRDRKIANSVQAIMRAFAPWMDTKHSELDRVRSLTTIFREAAGLGVFLFAQPSELQFQWPTENESGRGRVAITPALVKITDEYGRMLAQAQSLVRATLVKL